MKNLITTTLILTLSLLSLTAQAGHKVGNGGDYLRATFISMGKSVVKYLGETKEGQKILDEHKLSLPSLEESLDINRITVTDAILKDNTGSVVDALGVPELITLNSGAWFEHFQNGRDIYYLVFHEMLRSASVDDDNYKISRAIKNFPLSLRIETRVVPVSPLVESDRLSGIFNDKSITLGGNGCPNIDQEIITELNEEKNIFQVSMKKYRALLEGSKRLDYKSCSMAIPVKLPAKKRLVISLIDLNGDLGLQAGSSAKLSFEAFLSGDQNKVLEKSLNAQTTQKNSFLMRKSDVLKSSCGGSDTMRINSNLTARSNSDRSEFVAVKSIHLYLSLEDCKK